MPVWEIPLHDLDSITLASDIRFGSVDYCNDQIWELKVANTVPPALALSTTFGLRACRFQIFPQLTEDLRSVCDPGTFIQPPIIKTAYPNFARVVFSPFAQIEAEAEYWVFESQACCGRLRLVNHANYDRSIRVEWAALLTPLEQAGEAGYRMAATQIQRVWVLSGRTGALAPVLYMLGGAEVLNVPFPALTLTADLPPGTLRDWYWAHGALSTPEESYRLARSALNRNWDAERARLEMQNAGVVDIQTGDRDWDTAFALSQQIAHGLFVETNTAGADHPPSDQVHPAMVITRQPDQGYSLRGDGSDYNTLWSGVSPLQIYYSAQLFLPAHPDLLKGLIRFFLAVQEEENGFLDLRPGLGGQRSRLLATPLLASLAWKVHQCDEDNDFLGVVYEPLLRFIQLWFSEHDRDGDGIPEMEHPSQLGIENHPVFGRQAIAAQGAPFSVVESPAMCALLYAECQALQRMAQILNKPAPVLLIGSPPQHIDIGVVVKTLHQVTTSCWMDDDASYHYRDRDTHLHPLCLQVFQKEGAGLVMLERQFTEPVRLVLRLDSVVEKTQRPLITLIGTDAVGRPCREEIPLHRWQWILLKTGRVTTQNAFRTLEKAEINQIGEQDRLVVTTLAGCFEDVSLLLPLWANMVEEERIGMLIGENLLNEYKYWQPYGIPVFPLHMPGLLDREGFTAAAGSETPGWVNACEVSLPWNVLIGEGLLAYGYRKEAADLVVRLLNGIAMCLRRDKALRRSFHAVEGYGYGERNALDGLVPLDFFLRTLGVTIISPWRVGLNGLNPFPFPVRVKYRGLRIECLTDKTLITFPDEQVVEVFDSAPCIVSSEDENG